MDLPSIQIAAAVVGGVGCGALLTAVAAGLNALGDAGLHAVQEAGGADAPTAARALSKPEAIRTRVSVGRVLCFTLAATAAGYDGFMRSGLLAGSAIVVAVAFLYIAISAVASVVARRRAARVPLKLLKLLRPLDVLFAPLAWPINALEQSVVRLLPERETDNQERMTELTVEHVIDVGEERGSLAQDHARMLRSVLEFKNTVAREVMVARQQIVAFDVGASVQDVLASIAESGHSRYPIYRDQIDHVEGVLYAKDLFQWLSTEQDQELDLSQIVRKPAFFAAETQKIGALLREMQRRRSHLALVVDEFGGVSGIVTLEDIVEEIVGDIQDEHDEEPAGIFERVPGHYFVEASVSIHDLEDHLGESVCDDKTEFDTVGGMVVHLGGRVPMIGERLRTGDFQVVVLDADERHVTRVELVRVGDQANEVETPTPPHAASA